MNFNSHLNEENQQDLQNPALTTEDIAALAHYPSLDKLFQDKDLSALSAMKTKLSQTFQNLERVIMRGSESDAKQAKFASLSVKNALEFLNTLEKTRKAEI